jgi:hypothetical protein
MAFERKWNCIFGVGADPYGCARHWRAHERTAPSCSTQDWRRAVCLSLLVLSPKESVRACSRQSDAFHFVLFWIWNVCGCVCVVSCCDTQTSTSLLHNRYTNLNMSTSGKLFTVRTLRHHPVTPRCFINILQRTVRNLAVWNKMCLTVQRWKFSEKRHMCVSHMNTVKCEILNLDKQPKFYIYIIRYVYIYIYIYIENGRIEGNGNTSIVLKWVYYLR